MFVSAALKDLNSAEEAYARISPELDALSPDDLSPYNVELIGAAAVVLGVADRIAEYRERMAALPEFDIKHADNLVNYALGAWYVHVTNLPKAEPKDADLLIKEVIERRAKLLMWAVPLASAGYLEQAAVDRIKEGAGHKDAASDLVALVVLFRSRWQEIESKCDVTQDDLARCAEIGPKVFALLGRRENRLATRSDGALRVHRAWTLLDRAYDQCRRALQYLRFDQKDADRIAPSLRTNSGPRTATVATTPAVEATPASDASPLTSTTADSIGAGDGPFTSAQS